jgi:hypothetical protein
MVTERKDNRERRKENGETEKMKKISIKKVRMSDREREKERKGDIEEQR